MPNAVLMLLTQILLSFSLLLLLLLGLDELMELAHRGAVVMALLGYQLSALFGLVMFDAFVLEHLLPQL